MAFKDGDFVEVAYSAWSVADNRMLETTDEAQAKGAGIYNDKISYGPVLVIIGSGGIVKGLDNTIKSMEVGSSKKVTLKPADAFGERNQDLVRIMPLSDFRKRDIDPRPGMHIDIDNVDVVVKSVNSGRVVVDANHPYAGIELTYEVTIKRHLTKPEEKISALGKTYRAEPTSSKASGSMVELVYDETVAKNANYFIGKANLVAALFTYFKDSEKVTVTESYKRPSAPPESPE